MGWAECRFREKTDCKETSSGHTFVTLSDLNTILNIPDMWRHYLTTHLVQPTKKERDIVMRSNPDQATSRHAMTMSSEKPTNHLEVLYVEKTSNGYTHSVGKKVDTEFLSKLELLISKGERTQTRGMKLPKFEF